MNSYRQLTVKQGTPSRTCAAAATVSALAPVRDQVLTITTDNGKEMARHRQISDAVGAPPVYFARPYHAWERG